MAARFARTYALSALGGFVLTTGGGCALFQPVVTPLPAKSPAVAARPMETPASQPSEEAAQADPSLSQVEAWAQALAERRAGGDGRPTRLAGDAGLPREGVVGLPTDYLREVAGESGAAGAEMGSVPAAGGEGHADSSVNAGAAAGMEADRAALAGQGASAERGADQGSGTGETASAAGPTAPPTLLSVNVAPQASAGRRAGDSTAAATGVNQAQASEVAASLREFVARLPAGRDGASLVDEVDHRLLQALAGQADEARAPLQYADPGQARLIEGMIDLVLTLRESPDPARLEQARATLDRLQGTIRDVSDLTIPELAICTRVEGFGRYTELNPPEFRAGGRSEFVAYCELRNFASKREANGEYRSEFALRLEVRNRVGDLVHEFAGEDIVDRCRSPRTDCFIAPLVRLPAGLAPGDYVVKVTLIDKIGQKVAQRRSAVRIVAE